MLGVNALGINALKGVLVKECDIRLKPYLEPPIRRWQYERAMSREAYEETYRMIGSSMPEAEKDAHKARVIYPHGYIAQSLMGAGGSIEDRPIPEQEAWLASMKQMASFSLSVWINNVWGLDKVIAVYPPNESHKVIEDSWWRGYTTDYVLEHFKPWMIYVSFCGMNDSTGALDLYEGMYVAFDYFEGEIRLALLHMTKRGTFDPFYFHEFTFKPGMTLGDVVDQYEYTSPYRQYVEYALSHERQGQVSKKGFEMMMQLSGQAMAKRVLPLVLGLIGGEFETKHFGVEMQGFGLEVKDAQLPDRKEGIDPTMLVTQSADEAALFLIRRWQRGRTDLN